MSAMDLQRVYLRTETVARYREAREAASAKLEVAQMELSMAHLLSRFNPLESLGIDRDAFRILISYIHHGDMPRLDREVDEFLRARGCYVESAEG